MSSDYQFRGQRVSPLAEAQIQNSAIILCEVLGFKPSRSKNKKFDVCFERLAEYGITLDPVEDKDWSSATHLSIIGHYDPQTLTIRVPNSKYVEACKGDRTALAILFHELGHLVLGHQPSMHFSVMPPTQAEDAEWQADMFAEYALAHLNYEMRQLTFDFY